MPHSYFSLQMIKATERVFEFICITSKEDNCIYIQKWTSQEKLNFSGGTYLGSSSRLSWPLSRLLCLTLGMRSSKVYPTHLPRTKGPTPCTLFFMSLPGLTSHVHSIPASGCPESLEQTICKPQRVLVCGYLHTLRWLRAMTSVPMSLSESQEIKTEYMQQELLGKISSWE